MSIESEAQLLRAMPLFRAVPAARCKLVAMSSERLDFATGEHIFVAGQPSEAVFVIVSGRVRVTRPGADRVIDIVEMGEGTLVGDIGVMIGRPRNVNITAIEPTVALRIEGRVFVELLHQVPEICFALARNLAERADQADARYVGAAGGT